MNLLLMKSFIKYLNCGRVKERSNQNKLEFVVTKSADIEEKIIPFFQRNSLQGIKIMNYLDFCKVAELMNKKAHLTEEGLEVIRKIKAGMNTGRK